jgi:hypothetical protein
MRNVSATDSPPEAPQSPQLVPPFPLGVAQGN